MVQLTLTTGAATKKVADVETVKVPIFIFTDKAEATELAELIVKVKPTYLINCSNSVESLRKYINSGKLANNICYIFNSEAVTEIKADEELLTKTKVIDLFRCN